MRWGHLWEGCEWSYPVSPHRDLPVTLLPLSLYQEYVARREDHMTGERAMENVVVHRKPDFSGEREADNLA